MSSQRRPTHTAMARIWIRFGTVFASTECQKIKGVECVMSLVRLLGFTTLACGCVVGRYREVATRHEVTYVEEKGKICGSHGHRRNHTVASKRLASGAS